MRVLIIGLVALLVLLVAIFWKSVPLEGAEGIKNELQALEMSGAQKWAPESFSEAQQAVEKALAEFKKQDDRIPVFRSLGQLDDDVSAARELMTKTVEAVSKAKEARAAEILKEIAVIEEGLGKAFEMLKQAPKEGSDRPLHTIRGDLESIGRTVGDSRSKVERGEVPEETPDFAGMSEQVKNLSDKIPEEFEKMKASAGQCS